MDDPGLFALYSALLRANSALDNAEYHTTWSVPDWHDDKMKTVKQEIEGIHSELTNVLNLVTYWVEQAKEEADVTE